MDINKKFFNTFLILFLGFFSSGSFAAFSTDATIYGDLIPTQTDGGLNVIEASVSDSGTDVFKEATRDSSASAYANAFTRNTAFDLASSIVVPVDGPSPVSTVNVESSIRITDNAIIGAGGTFELDDPVQVLLQVKLDGLVQLEGRPFALSDMNFRVFAGTGLPLLLDFSTGTLNPPQNFEVHEFWEFLVDVKVGDTMPFRQDLDGALGWTSFDPGTGGVNLMNFNAIVAVTHAPGFEDLNISIDSGAPVSPIPVPAAVWLFGSGLICLVGFARGKNVN